MRRNILWGLLFAMVLLWSVLSIRSILRNQWMQEEAERWQGLSDQRYCQVSAFWSAGEMDAKQAAAVADELDQRFREETEPVPILLAWGGKTDGLATFNRRNAEAELWYVTETFFTLHRFSTLEGGSNAFSAGGRVAIVNEEAAWRLFGSVHGCGENLVIEGERFRVIAVLQDPKDSANKAAYGSTARIYLPLKEGASVTFFEAVLPEYYTGYAAQALADAAGTDVVTNTGRFRLASLWKAGKAFFAAPPKAQPDLPPWEKSARLATRHLCVLWCILFLDAVLGLLLIGKGAWSFGRRCLAHKASEKRQSKRFGRLHVPVYALCDDSPDHPSGGDGSGGEC